MRDDTPLWLFADQLGPAVHGGEHAHREVLLVEATSALRKRRYHRQKLHLVLSALRHAEHDLGDRATLIRADTYTDALRRFNRPVLVHEPTSHAAEQFVQHLYEQRPRRRYPAHTDIRVVPQGLPRVGRRAHTLPDGGLLPRPAPPVRRPDERVRSRRQPVELRRGQPRTSTEETVDAGAARPVPAPRRRHRRRRSGATSTGWTSTPSASTVPACSPSPPPRPSGR